MNHSSHVQVSSPAYSDVFVHDHSRLSAREPSHVFERDLFRDSTCSLDVFKRDYSRDTSPDSCVTIFPVEDELDSLVSSVNVTIAATCVDNTVDRCVTAFSACADAAKGDSSESIARRDSACSFTVRDVFTVDNDFIQKQINLHEVVHASGAYNYKHCRIPLSTHLNISLWRSYLVNYCDSIVCDYLEFGWPVGYLYDVHGFPLSNFRNHSGALNFPSDMHSYLQGELARKSVVGPFISVPFRNGMAVSPLYTVPKKDTSERRVILDLSWPPGTSVNDGILPNVLDGSEFQLSYPTVDSIAALVVQKGPGCLIYKRDLKRAYRQFRVDPYDFPLLGFKWEDQYFFDIVLPMGLRSAAMACQRITNAVSYICAQHGFDVLNYLDDFQGVETPDNADRAFRFTQSLLNTLGLVESHEKACPPSTTMTCLGVQVDTVDMTISVTPARVQELSLLLDTWLHKKSATKRELQSLLGKLSFVSKCVRQSRIFLMRLLDLLRSVKRNHHHVNVTSECRKDIKWWKEFLPQFNGVSIIYTSCWSSPDEVFATDACLTGCGGCSGSRIFHKEFPADVLVQFPFIHQLECLAILVAVRLWGSAWKGLRLTVFCDNEAVVQVLNSGKTRDALLGKLLRNIWLVSATNEFELRAVHLPGVENRVADLLSRWHLNPEFYSAQLHAQSATSIQYQSEEFDNVLFELNESF